MLAAGVATLGMHFGAASVEFPFTLLVIVPAALTGAAIGTFAFKPEPLDILIKFFNKVRPPGPGWNLSNEPRGFPLYEQNQESSATPGEPLQQKPTGREGLLRPTFCWIMGTIAIYFAMFGVGDLLLKSKLRGVGLVAAAVVLAIVVGLASRPDANEDDPTSEHFDTGNPL